MTGKGSFPYNQRVATINKTKKGLSIRGSRITERIKREHPYRWLWEPLESEPTFLLRPMFGGRAAYLDGKLVLYFSAKKDPWRGVLVCTERVHHSSLLAEYPDLVPHPVLPKWLYLPEHTERFEYTAALLTARAKHRDPRLGVISPPKKHRTGNGK